MSKLLDDVRGLLRPVELKVTKGEIVEVKANTLIVRTLQGLREFAAVNAGQFKVGDRVRVDGDLVVSRVAGSGSLPTYTV